MIRGALGGNRLKTHWLSCRGKAGGAVTADQPVDEEHDNHVHENDQGCTAKTAGLRCCRPRSRDIEDGINPIHFAAQTRRPAGP